ncbi:MAG: type II toxin-antitoxin system HicA family toxin [Candidatus Nitrospinota bacterium M3_3B_026]
MGKSEKIYLRILTGRSDKNIQFQDLRRLLVNVGFREKVKGSHFIYTKKDVLEIINIQEKKGMAKPYQVKQVRRILVKYKLEPGDEQQI